MTRKQSSLALLCMLIVTTLAATPPPYITEGFHTITVVVDNDYPPYAFQSRDKLVGIIPDQWRAWSKVTGLPVTILGLPWAIAQKEFAEGRADVLDSVFETLERKKTMLFSPAYARIDVPLYMHKSLTGIVSLQDLEGFKVGVKKGDAVIDVLSAAGVRDLVVFPTYLDIIKAASQLDIQIFTIDGPPANYLLYKHSLDKEFRIAFTINSGTFHRAVRLNDTRLFALVNYGFQNIPIQTYENINKVWLGSELPRLINYNTIRIVIVSIVVFILFLLGIILFTRRRVARATKQLKQTIDALQHSEGKLKTALADREMLLREVHHRVKNSLTIVTSILSLERDLVMDPRDAILFEETQARLRSVSLVHEHLYKSNGFRTIDLAKYLQDLVNAAADLFAHSHIQISTSFESIPVLLDVATPTGLIMMEAMTNAFRHGVSGTEGKIVTTLQRKIVTKNAKPEHLAELIIQDNGRGFPDIVDEGLGYKLIEALATQLRAQIVRSNQNGAHLKVVIPVVPVESTE